MNPTDVAAVSTLLTLAAAQAAGTWWLITHPTPRTEPSANVAPATPRP